MKRRFNEIKREVIAFLALAFAAMCFLTACGEKKGDPATVKAWEEIAKKGCECADTDCLYAIKVQGKGIMKWVTDTDVSKMNEKELQRYQKARAKYSACEKSITGHQH